MSMIESVIIYLMTILISVGGFYLYTKIKQKTGQRFFLFLAIVVPVFIAGVRYDTGTDYFSYINAFDSIQRGDQVRFNLEYGYVLLNTLVSWLGLGSQGIMFASSLLVMFFVSKALILRRNVISVGAGALTFMLCFYQSSFNIVRMMIAVSIFLYNITNIEERNLLKYLLFTFLAASFHVSALVTIPLYWVIGLRRLGKSLLWRTIIYIGTGLLIFNFNPIAEFVLSTLNLNALFYYENYIGVSDKSADIGIKEIILYLPMLLPGIFMYKKCQAQDKSFYIYYSLLAMGVIIIGAATFQATYVDRFAEYFTIAAVMVVAVYIRVFNKNGNIFCFTGMVFYLFLYWVYVYVISNTHETVPYQWIL